MQLPSYRRARRLLDARPGPALASQVWGTLHSLLLFALLLWSGLLLSLLLSRGVTLVLAQELVAPKSSRPSGGAPAAVTGLPSWLSDRLPLPSDRLPLSSRTNLTLGDTGLYPIVARNQASRNPAHALAARLVRSLLSAFPTLRYNNGALMSLLAVGLVLLLAFSIVDQLRNVALAEASSQVATALRRQIHRQMYRLGQSALPTEGIGSVTNLFTREVNDVRSGVLVHLSQVPRTPILAAGLVVLAFLVSWNLALFLVALGLLVWVVARTLGRGARRAAEAAARDAALQLCLLHEDLGLLRTVRVYGMESVDNRRFDEHLERHGASDVRVLRTEESSSPATILLAGAAAIMAAGLIGYNILEGQLASAAGILLIASLVALWWPAADWLALRRSLRQANRSAGALFTFLERRPELQQAGGARFLPPLRERITFEEVSLQSPSGKVLLDGVSAELRAGSRTAILGLDEEAKLGMVCMIPRLIDPRSGRVRIDGIDLRDVTLESLRAQVATVLQADLVFSDSVAANIGLGDPSYSLPRIIEAAKIAHAHHFIQDLPHGYDTIIGPLGHYLRVDEQYRIALARAYLHDPSIVIVEEPTAPLDDAIKHLIDDTVARLAQGRTLIFLPHRLSTIRACDQAILLHEGRIEAIGPPGELQASSKLFRHIQYVEFNQFATGEIEAGQMVGA